MVDNPYVPTDSRVGGFAGGWPHGQKPFDTNGIPAPLPWELDRPQLLGSLVEAWRRWGDLEQRGARDHWAGTRTREARGMPSWQTMIESCVTEHAVALAYGHDVWRPAPYGMPDVWPDVQVRGTSRPRNRLYVKPHENPWHRFVFVRVLDATSPRRVEIVGWAYGHEVMSCPLRHDIGAHVIDDEMLRDFRTLERTSS